MSELGMYGLWMSGLVACTLWMSGLVACALWMSGLVACALWMCGLWMCGLWMCALRMCGLWMCALVAIRRQRSFDGSCRKPSAVLFSLTAAISFSMAWSSARSFGATQTETSTGLTSSAQKKNSKPTANNHSQKRVFKSVSSVVQTHGDTVRNKLKPVFAAENVEYPPKAQTWVALKKEKQLVIFAPDRTGKVKRLLNYHINGASGVAGPKLKEGDKQVPEGFYRITAFRPNVIAHLGLYVNYPNEEDRAHARAEKRTNLGSDILIHGSYWSTGCLAIGNEPIEELFVLAYDAGFDNIKLIFAPCNLLTEKPDVDFKKQPAWLEPLYARIRNELKKYPL